MKNTQTGNQQKVTVNTPEEFREMPDEYKELVIRQLMVHTEGELTGADDYIQLFYPMAPNAYEKQVCCERAAEEMDHYQRGARVLADIGMDTDYMLKQSLERRKLFNTELVKDIRTWTERGFFSFLGEAGVMDMLLEMAESSYVPVRHMLAPVIKDEKVHIAHGYRIIRDLCKTDEGRAEAQESLKRMWPATLDGFGRSDSKRSVLYQKWGLRQRSNEEARQAFIKKTVPKLEALGLEVPDHNLNRKFV